MTLINSATDQVGIPGLRIVELGGLIEPEFNDSQWTRPPAKRLQAEGILENLPSLASLSGDDPRLVVLDGANRIMALQEPGYQHWLVHVVADQPPSVALTTWHHLVVSLEQAALSQAIRALPGIDLVPIDLLLARAGLARRELLTYIVLADNQVVGARPQLPGLNGHEQNRLLKDQADTYKVSGRIDRTVADDLSEARRLYLDLADLAIFPKYEPAEVLALACDGDLLPTGVTRHLIQGRALRAELPAAGTVQPRATRCQERQAAGLPQREVFFQCGALV